MSAAARLPFLIFAAVPLLLLAACGDGGNGLDSGYPAAGEDRFELTRATVQIEVTAPGVGARPVAIQQLETIEIEGPTLVTRSDPQDADADGLVDVQTEIVEMELRGTASFGEVIVRQHPEQRSMGMVEQQAPGQDFPADSFFDVFVEVQLPGANLIARTEEPVRMEAEINDLPPAEGDEYRTADGEPVPLITPTESAIQIGRIVDALHVPNPPPAEEEEEEEETPEATPTSEAEPTPTAPAAEPELRLGCEHTQPGIQSQLIILVVNAQPGQTMQGTVTGTGVIGDGRFTLTIGDDGTGEHRQPIDQFGPYAVQVDGLSGTFLVEAECTPP